MNKNANGWKTKRFTEFCKLKHGFQFREEHFAEKGIPVIKIGNLVDGGGIREDNLTFIKPELLEQFENFKLNEGDVLMALTGGTLGKVCIFPKRENTYLQNYRVGNFIPLENAIRDYIAQLLQSYIVQERIFNLVNEAAQPNFGKQDFDKIKVNLPPLLEQKAIAHVLGLMDTAINKNNQLIAQKELRKKWLMQNLLTGKKRLKGYCDNWKRYKLECLIEEYKAKPVERKSYEVFTSSKIGLMKQTDYYGNNRITNREDADYNVIPPGYLTYRSRSEVGLFTFNKNNFGIVGLVSGYYPVFTIKNGSLDFILMYCNYHKQRLKKFSIGTSQLVLSIEALKSATFELPNEKEQNSIAKVLIASDKEIQLLKTKTEKLQQQKKWLMQVLLTGKKRLTKFEV